MPILPPEPFVFPPTLFSEPDSPAALDWFVAHTKPRAEKALARWLLGRSVRYFLPLYRKESQLNGRTLTSYMPLFPGYLFVSGGADARYSALASHQVANCLAVHAQEELVDDLQGVYRLMTGDHPISPVADVPPGTPVEVVDGPFAGLTGRVLKPGPRARLVVEVRMIRQGVSVELNRAAVRPLTENGEAVRARIALIRR
jgi:transcription antitermination factor NusG